MLMWTETTDALDRTREDEIEAQIETATNREMLRNAASAERWRRERDAQSSRTTKPSPWSAERAIAWTILGVCALYFAGLAFEYIWRLTR